MSAMAPASVTALMPGSTGMSLPVPDFGVSRTRVTTALQNPCMRVMVRVAGEGRPEAEALSLRDALLRDPGLRSVRVREQTAAAKPGEMGSLQEVGLVLLGAGGVGTILVQSLCNWLAGRRTHVRLVITRDDYSVEIDVAKARDHREVIALCQRFGVPVGPDSESRNDT